MAAGLLPVPGELPPLPPGATLDEDLPPLPTGARIDAQPAARPPASQAPLLSLQTITGTVDGDTARLSGRENLRLLGVDAPELGQQGWRRDGTAVPLGEISRGALDGYLSSGDSVIGREAMRSYGRPVAPVEVDGTDVGWSMARSGNAFAAPEYLANDPERRFDYMQAERLARQNRLTTIAQVPEFAAGAVVGAARRAVMGKRAQDRILASEVGARAIGLLQGAKEGARLFARALRTGEPDDFTSKVEGDQYKAIEGLKGEVIRIPTRLLTAEDQLFKGVARRMELNAQAVRIAHREGLRGDDAKRRIAELVTNPTDDMFQRALDYGKYLTFQRKLGEFGQGVSRITSASLPAKIIVPFVRTPINLLKFATERSIAAPLLKEWRADFRVGGERRDLAIARSMLGTGFAAVIYEAALDGRITGAVPSDPAKARLMYADGWQPYSIRVGDRYISYSRLDPFATTIGVAADMATLGDGLSDRQQEDKTTLFVASIMGNLANKTWLSGVSSFVEALSEPDRFAATFVNRLAGSFAVPAGVAGVARTMDPVSRQRESWDDAIRARVPGMSDSLLPRRDVFGEPVVNDSLGPDIVSPFWQTQARNDPVVAEMLRIGKGVSAPGRNYTEDGERVDYTPAEYDRYHELAGRLSYNSLLSLISTPEYERMGGKAQRQAATRTITRARSRAREVLDDPDYPVPDRGTEQDHTPPLPAGAVMDGLPALPASGLIPTFGAHA